MCERKSVEFLKIRMRKSFDKYENLCYYFKDRQSGGMHFIRQCHR